MSYISSILFFSNFALTVLGAPPAIPQEYPTPSPTQEYNPDIGQTNVGGYGVNKDPYCHKVEKVVFENQCEPYKEKTCWTQNKEICEPKFFKNCTGVIETNIERVCFNVNELVCNLVEAIHYETLEETYQVQRCFTGKDRVCDTTYKIDTTTKDDYQCCNVETPNCYMEEKVINDVTCTNTVEFDCRRQKTTKNDGYGQKLGFRIEGIKKDGNSSKDFKTTSTKEQVIKCFYSFLQGYPHALPMYLKRLEAIRSALENSAFFKTHELIGSSLLFVHDEKKANVWLIDFGKTVSVPQNLQIDHKSAWEVGNHEDGYLIGLDCILTIFKQFSECP